MALRVEGTRGLTDEQLSLLVNGRAVLGVLRELMERDLSTMVDRFDDDGDDYNEVRGARRALRKWISKLEDID